MAPASMPRFSSRPAPVQATQLTPFCLPTGRTLCSICLARNGTNAQGSIQQRPLLPSCDPLRSNPTLAPNGLLETAQDRHSFPRNLIRPLFGALPSSRFLAPTGWPAVEPFLIRNPPLTLLIHQDLRPRQWNSALLLPLSLERSGSPAMHLPPFPQRNPLPTFSALGALLGTRPPSPLHPFPNISALAYAYCHRPYHRLTPSFTPRLPFMGTSARRQPSTSSSHARRYAQLTRAYAERKPGALPSPPIPSFLQLFEMMCCGAGKC